MNGTNMGSDNLNMKMLKPLDEVLRCPICSEFFNNCVMTSCCHDFCSACIKRRIATESDCPICYEDLRESDLRNNGSMDKIVRIYKKLTSLDFLFCVVDFPEESQPPCVVPSAWLENDNEVLWCWFPKKDFRKHVLKKSSPEDGWDLFLANALHFSRERKDSDDYLKQYQKGSSYKTSEYESTPKKLKTSLSEEARYSTASSSSLKIKVSSSPNVNHLRARVPVSLNIANAQVSPSNIPHAQVSPSNIPHAQLLACGSCESNSDLNNKWMKKLDHMSEEISEMKTTLTVLAKRFLGPVDKIENVALPVESESDLNKLESLIEDNEEFAKYVKYLGQYGGRTVKEVTKRILVSFFHHSYAQIVNWVGGNGKTALKHYKRVLQLITAGVRETPVTSEAKQLEIEDRIKRWLRCAPDRNGGRNKRKIVDIQ